MNIPTKQEIVDRVSDYFERKKPDNMRDRFGVSLSSLAKHWDNIPLLFKRVFDIEFSCDKECVFSDIEVTPVLVPISSGEAIRYLSENKEANVFEMKMGSPEQDGSMIKMTFSFVPIDPKMFLKDAEG